MQNANNRKKGSKALPKKSRNNVHAGTISMGQPRQSTLTIPRSVNCYMPDRLRTTLRWWNAPVINLATVSTQGVRYQPSGAYDIDPNVGGAAMSGFGQLAAIYGSYRVRASTCKVEVVNPGLSTPVRVTLIPLNIDPGSAPTANYVIGSSEQPYAVSKLVGLRGSPPLKLEQTMTTSKIFGSPMVEFDDNFAALSTSIPVNNWFWFVGFYSTTTIPSTEGAVICNTFVQVDIEFYDRKFA